MTDARMTATPTLLPCPFCGSEAALHQVPHDESENAGGYYVECTNRGSCRATSILMFSCGEDCRPLLAERWNRRAAPPAAPQGEPTRHPCGHLIVADTCVVCAEPREDAQEAATCDGCGKPVRPLLCGHCAPASEPQAEPQPEAIPIAPVEVVRQALKELLESISECRMDQVTARFAKASVMARAVVDRYKDAT